GRSRSGSRRRRSHLRASGASSATPVDLTNRPPRALFEAMTSLRLYDYAASANCYKVRLLLAQLGVPYERVPVDIFDGDTLTDEFAAINPARTTPVLEDPPGTFLQESNAILLQLARGTRYLPDDPQVYRWLCY